MHTRERLTYVLTAVFSTLCVLALVWTIFLLRNSADDPGPESWYVQNGSVVIDAPAGGKTGAPRALPSPSPEPAAFRSAAFADEAPADGESTFVFLAGTDDPSGAAEDPAPGQSEAPADVFDPVIPADDVFDDDEPDGEPDAPAPSDGLFDEPDDGEEDDEDELSDDPATFFDDLPAYDRDPYALDDEDPDFQLDVPARTVTITFAGDCTLGGDRNSDAYKRFDKCYEKNGEEYFLSSVRSFLEQDDLTIVNLEGPLTDSGKKRRHRLFNFRGDPKYAGILSSGSVEVAGLGNNHSLDFGKKGLKNTASALVNAGIGVAGYNVACTTEVNGAKISFLSVTEWDYSVEQLEELVRAQRADNDLVLVMIHWGEEKVYKPSKNQVKYGRALVDAGADIVVGSHSHVVSGIEKYNGKYIVYGLGNFCFGGAASPYDNDCIMFRQIFRVSGDGIADAGIAIIPCSDTSSPKTNNYQPQILTGKAAARVLKKVGKYSNIKMDEIAWNSAMDPYLELLKK